MSNNEIREKLKQIMIDVLRLEKTTDEINGADLINELGISSIDAISIFIEIEDAFNIIIDDENLNASLISNLDKATEYVMARL